MINDLLEESVLDFNVVNEMLVAKKTYWIPIPKPIGHGGSSAQLNAWMICMISFFKVQ